MDYIRAIKTGFIAYAGNLVVLSMLQNILLPFIANVPSAQYIWQALVLIVTAGAVFYASQWYFKNGTASVNNGLLLGIFTTVFSLVLLVVQAFPGAVAAGKTAEFGTNFITLFKDYGFLLSVVATVGAATCSGFFSQKKTA